jgi:hypothetical protein
VPVEEEEEEEEHKVGHNSFSFFCLSIYFQTISNWQHMLLSTLPGYVRTYLSASSKKPITKKQTHKEKINFHIQTMHLDTIKVFIIYHLMHN